MAYHLDVNGTHRDPEVTSQSDSGAEVILGEQQYRLEFRRISGRKISLSVNGRQATAWVEKTGRGKTIVIEGRRYEIADRDAQAGTRSAASGAGQASDTITPPMPAIVIQVPVSEGETVEKGDTVVVVSAMKMETSLKAPYAGMVTRIGVAEGDKVMPGEILADIEKTEETV